MIGRNFFACKHFFVNPKIKIIRIDIDPVEIDRVHRPTVEVVGDAAPVLTALTERVGRYNRKRISRKKELDGFKAELCAEFERTLGPQVAYLDAIRAELPEDGIFVEDLTQVGYVARFAFPTYRPRTFITTGYQGTLGFGFATALGVKVARPETPVVAVTGDGGFMYNVQELATAVLHGINVVTVVFSDGAYGNVRRMQIDCLLYTSPSPRDRG